ncbi:MAG: hypothetical protein LBC99_02630 [Spirochaetota bacterium]|jgi:hypothetical protein|nr:hypothetical protein [Spirochaetota bacterium]
MKCSQGILLLAVCCAIFPFQAFAQEKIELSPGKTLDIPAPSKWDNILSFGASIDVGVFSLPKFGDTSFVGANRYDDTTDGAALNLEYLRSVAGIFKIGVGASLFGQSSDAEWGYTANALGVAPYGTFELWLKVRDQFGDDDIPIATALQEIYKDHVKVSFTRYMPVRSYIYLKGIAGYAVPDVFFDDAMPWYGLRDLRTKGGFYYGVGVGVMQTDGLLKGMFVQMSYKCYTGSMSAWFDDYSATIPISIFKKEAFSIHLLAIEFGWRFSLG